MGFSFQEDQTLRRLVIAVNELDRELCCLRNGLCDSIDQCLGIGTTGDSSLFLNQQGNWVSAVVDVSAPAQRIMYGTGPSYTTDANFLRRTDGSWYFAGYNPTFSDIDFQFSLEAGTDYFDSSPNLGFYLKDNTNNVLYSNSIGTIYNVNEAGGVYGLGVELRSYNLTTHDEVTLSVGDGQVSISALSEADNGGAFDADTTQVHIGCKFDALDNNFKVQIAGDPANNYYGINFENKIAGAYQIDRWPLVPPSGVGQVLQTDGAPLHSQLSWSAFRLPTTTGSNGETLVSDGTGGVSWQSVSRPANEIVYGTGSGISSDTGATRTSTGTTLISKTISSYTTGLQVSDNLFGLGIKGTGFNYFNPTSGHLNFAFSGDNTALGGYNDANTFGFFNINNGNGANFTAGYDNIRDEYVTNMQVTKNGLYYAINIDENQGIAFFFSSTGHYHLPMTQGNAGDTFINDGTGVISWGQSTTTLSSSGLIGDGINTSFTQAHGQSTTPAFITSTFKNSVAASGTAVWLTWDATNININFVTPPTVGAIEIDFLIKL